MSCFPHDKVIRAILSHDDYTGGNHAFRRYRTEPHALPRGGGLINFWLGWGEERMSEHYDKIKSDLAFRKEVANACGVGFEVPAALVSIEPMNLKFGTK